MANRVVKFRALHEGVWRYQTLEEILTIRLAAFHLGKHKTQFIGLLDKNGKEIYEGDIVQLKHPHKDRAYSGVVAWEGYSWGCEDFYFPRFDKPPDIFSEGTKHIEVIGNIHENPDLLK